MATIVCVHLVPSRGAVLWRREVEVISRFLINTISSQSVLSRGGRSAPAPSPSSRAATVASSGGGGEIVGST